VGWSLDGVITTWNSAAGEMFGYTAQEAVGQTISLIASARQDDELARVAARLREEGPMAPFESVRFTKGGRELAVSVAVSRVHDAGGRLVGASAIFRDITDLTRTRQALQQETRRKDEFLALLGHELRNPLAPLRNAVDIVATPGAGEARTRAAVGVLERQLAHMTSLVDQLLDASRITSGRIQLQLEEMDLAEVARTAAEDHRPFVEASGLALEVKLPAKPVWVSGDPVRLAQIASNLLTNAVKCTDAGGAITLEVRVDPRKGTVSLSVKDTGIGIEPEMLKRLFTPFTHGARSVDRTRGGLGLGLALVRALVESHGGSVEAHSEGKGRGAEFVVRLPLIAVRGRRAAASRAPQKDGSPQRVLLVEDNVDSAETLRTLLELAGHTVEVASNGDSALAAAKAFKPQVVLCDIGLPGGMDGYALAAALKDGPDGDSPYLVALTGYGQSADRDRARAAGFDRHLTKPADPNVIRQILAERGGG
jgi:PAS domain S-box-containing protein